MIEFGFVLLLILGLLLHEWFEQNVPFVDDIEWDHPRPAMIEDDLLNEIDNNNNNNNANEEDIVAGVDDFNGLLQGIGIRGNILNLFQNASLITLLLCFSIGIGVWIPYIIGVLFIMFRPWKLIKYLIEFGRRLLDSILDRLIDEVTRCIPLSIQSVLRSILLHIHQPSAEVVPQPVNNTIWQAMYQYFIDMPSSEDYKKIAGCIATGYLVVKICGAIYLSRTRHHARIQRLFCQMIHQAYLCLKVTVFIGVELYLLPIVCGYLLDAALFDLFFGDEKVWLEQTISYLEKNRWTSRFLHWFVGTTFMFLFTSTINFFRSILRPGALWFIRDPNDPQFHPIKELVERPVWTQLKRLCLVAFIYLCVIIAGVGPLVDWTAIVCHSLLPLRLNYSQPLSVVPIDLLAYMFLMPGIVACLDAKDNFIVWFTWLLHQFRLSHFFLGTRRIEEEGEVSYKTWKAWIQRPKYDMNANQVDVLTFHPNGQFLRVPKHDRVRRHVPGQRMLVPVSGVTQEGHPAARNSEELEENTTVVYAPPNFEARVIMMMITLWTSVGIFALFGLLILPIVIGRQIVKGNDVYAHFLGCCTLFCVKLVKKIKQPTFSQTMAWVRNLMVILMSFGIILPLLFGLLLEFYVIIPSQATERIVIQPVFVWANGLVLLELIVQLSQQILPATHNVNQSIDRLKSQGIDQFSIKQEMRQVALPLIIMSFSMLLLPFLSVKFYSYIFSMDDHPKLYQKAYPLCSITIGLYYMLPIIKAYINKWIDSVREDYYLIGRVLHNFE
ncbi:hypothetical protein RMCBS344292_15123 [Rhizopus microsporus]|nr:hypothetical protein RMCBS344292_15123 [Rhizopus microsporus]